MTGLCIVYIVLNQCHMSKVRGSWHSPKELMQEGLTIWGTSKEVLWIESIQQPMPKLKIGYL
jgi:hypothetical protein